MGPTQFSDCVDSSSESATHENRYKREALLRKRLALIRSQTVPCVEGRGTDESGNSLGNFVIMRSTFDLIRPSVLRSAAMARIGHDLAPASATPCAASTSASPSTAFCQISALFRPYLWHQRGAPRAGSSLQPHRGTCTVTLAHGGRGATPGRGDARGGRKGSRQSTNDRRPGTDIISGEASARGGSRTRVDMPGPQTPGRNRVASPARPYVSQPVSGDEEPWSRPPSDNKDAPRAGREARGSWGDVLNISTGESGE